MKINFDSKDCRFLRFAVRGVQNAEQSQEIRIPDGFPDVGKIVSAWGQIIVRSKEWHGDCVQFTGGMMVWILYLPENGVKAQYLDTWIPFAMKWDLPESTPEGTIRILPIVRFVDARLASPRKIMLRAGINTYCEAMSVNVQQIRCVPSEQEDMEILQKETEIRLAVESAEKAFHIDEEIPDTEDVVRCIYYTVHPEISEHKVISNKIAFRGNINLHLLYENRKGEIVSRDSEIPFSQFVQLETSCSTDAQADAIACITGLEIENGDDGNCRLKSGITVQFIVDDLCTVNIVEDAYSLTHEVLVNREELDLPEYIQKRTQSISAGKSILLEAEKAVDICFNPDYPRAYLEGENICLEAAGTIQMLCQNSEGDLTTTAARWEGKTTFAGENHCDICVVPGFSKRPRILENGGAVEAEAEMPVAVRMYKSSGLSMISEIEIGDTRDPDPNRPTYILQKANGFALWDIAKKHMSSVKAIQETNRLSESPKRDQILVVPVK